MTLALLHLSPRTDRWQRPIAVSRQSFQWTPTLLEIAALAGCGAMLGLLGLIAISILRGGIEPLLVLLAYLAG